MPKNPDAEGFYYWTIKVGIAKEWVADGLDLTEETIHAMLTTYYSHLYEREVKTEVLDRPPDEAMAKEMGYESVEDYLKERNQE